MVAGRSNERLSRRLGRRALTCALRERTDHTARGPPADLGVRRAGYEGCGAGPSRAGPSFSGERTIDVWSGDRWRRGPCDACAREGRGSFRFARGRAGGVGGAAGRWAGVGTRQ